VKSHNYNGQYAFKEAITWTKISSSKFACRYVPFGFMFDDAGPICTVSSQNIEKMLSLLNSKVGDYYLSVLSPTMNILPGHINSVPIDYMKICEYSSISAISIETRNISKADWDAFETSWDFEKHPLLSEMTTIAEAFTQFQQFTEIQFNQLKSNEEELNRIFIDIYGLQDELTPDVEDKDVTIRKADLGRDIRSFISYAVGCMFGRYSLDVDGLIYAGGEWDDSKYSTFIPDKDNILPVTDEEYFEDDVVGLFCAFIKKTFSVDTLEENLDYIAKALGNKGNSSRQIIRNYFLKDFFKDHCKVYQKRPIYWLFDSGKAEGFKALVYMHRYNENTIGNLRIDYLHRMQRIYDSEISRMQETIDNSKDAREVTTAVKRKEKLAKQLKETKEYDEKIAHLALARTAIDLDDGVKVNYEKVQTGTDGKKLEVLAKI
jgi:type II restriction/modification system DNA methylase subunit YeeA